jgi:hypothetical protein
MRDNSQKDFRDSKEVARKRYGERQIEKYIKWSIYQKGLLKWRDLVDQQNMYNITTT